MAPLAMDASVALLPCKRGSRPSQGAWVGERQREPRDPWTSFQMSRGGTVPS